MIGVNNYHPSSNIDWYSTVSTVISSCSQRFTFHIMLGRRSIDGTPGLRTPALLMSSTDSSELKEICTVHIVTVHVVKVLLPSNQSGCSFKSMLVEDRNNGARSYSREMVDMSHCYFARFSVNTDHGSVIRLKFAL